MLQNDLSHAEALRESIDASQQEDLEAFLRGVFQGGRSGDIPPWERHSRHRSRAQLGSSQPQLPYREDLGRCLRRQTRPWEAMLMPGEEVELEVIQKGARKKIMVVLAADPARAGSIFPPRVLGRPGSSSSSISSVTVNDGDLSITVRNANGKKTFSVRRGKEVLAKDEPWEALDKLPAEIQEKVRRLNSGPAGKPKNDKGSEPLPPGEKKLPPGKESKKPI